MNLGQVTDILSLFSVSDSWLPHFAFSKKVCGPWEEAKELLYGPLGADYREPGKTRWYWSKRLCVN